MSPDIWTTPYLYYHGVAAIVLCVSAWIIFASDRSVISSWLALAATLRGNQLLAGSDCPGKGWFGDLGAPSRLVRICHLLHCADPSVFAPWQKLA